MGKLRIFIVNVFVLYVLLLLVEIGQLVYVSYIRPANIIGNPHAHPMTIQFLHPHYFFSTAWRDEHYEMVGTSREAMQMTKDDFRGPGPEAQGQKKLAFLTGGSTAFGAGVDDYRQTITGHLNQLQNEYHFVNAGVPSWVSFQEFIRVAHQLIQMKPDLIISLSGYNNASLVKKTDMSYLLAPESVAYLAFWVDDIRSPAAHLLRRSPLVRLITLHGIRNHFFPDSYEYLLEERPPLEQVNKIASKGFIHHFSLIEQLAQANDFDFHLFLQPLNKSQIDDFEIIDSFYSEATKEAQRVGLKFSHFKPIQKKLFLDDCHFGSAGHRELAIQIWNSLQLSN